MSIEWTYDTDEATILKAEGPAIDHPLIKEILAEWNFDWDQVPDCVIDLIKAWDNMRDVTLVASSVEIELAQALERAKGRLATDRIDT